MKKTVTVIVLLTAVMVFFCSPVTNAAYTYILSDRSTQSTRDGITVTLTSTQYNITSVSYFATGGAWTPIVYVLQIYNNNTSEKLVNSLGFTSTFPSSAVVLNTEVFSTDLVLGDHSSNNYWYVTPRNEFSYANGIVVPPKESLYLICQMDVAADFNSTNNTFTANVQNGMSISTFTVSSGTYPYGTSVDFSPLVSILNNTDQSVEDIHDLLESYTAAMTAAISDIDLDNIEYSGTNYQFTGEAVQDVTTTIYTPSQNNALAKLDVRRFVGKPYLIELSVDTNSTTDTQTINGTKRYPFIINMNYDVNSPVIAYYQNVIGYLFPHNSNVYINYFYSDIYSGLSIDGDSVRFTFKHYVSDTRRTYLKQTYNRTTIIGYVECSVAETITFQNVYLNGFFGSVVADPDNTYYPMDEYTILRDLYIAQNAQINNSDFDDTTEGIADDNEYVHQQEQSYYQLNNAYIESTGLQNYNFTTTDRNGIGAVRNDFVDLWNALGSYTSVYIFSLTFGLALTILRYVPAGVSSIRRRNNRSGGKDS